MLALFHSLQIILVVVDLGQHWLHSHLKIWSRQSGVTLGTLRLSSHSKFIKIDRLVFETLWKSFEYGLWILKIFTSPASFQKEQFSLFYSECRERIVLNWWQKRHNLMEWRKECPFWVDLVFAFLMFLPFSWVNISLFLFFFSISVFYSDQYDCLIGITK